MSFFIIGLLVAVIAGLATFTGLLFRKVVAMDAELVETFEYVGDNIGRLMIRLNRVEVLTASETEATDGAEWSSALQSKPFEQYNFYQQWDPRDDATPEHS